jgi:hypothetical protein
MAHANQDTFRKTSKLLWDMQMYQESWDCWKNGMLVHFPEFQLNKLYHVSITPDAELAAFIQDLPPWIQAEALIMVYDSHEDALSHGPHHDEFVAHFKPVQ